MGALSNLFAQSRVKETAEYLARLEDEARLRRARGEPISEAISTYLDSHPAVYGNAKLSPDDSRGTV